PKESSAPTFHPIGSPRRSPARTCSPSPTGSSDGGPSSSPCRTYSTKSATRCSEAPCVPRGRDAPNVDSPIERVPQIALSGSPLNSGRQDLSGESHKPVTWAFAWGGNENRTRVPSL